MITLTVAFGSSAFSSAIADQQQLTLHQLTGALHAGWHWGKLPLAEHLRLKGGAKQDQDRAAADKDTRWFSLAKFRVPVRNDANVESVSGFVGDFDKGTWSIDAVSTVLDGTAHLAYTTYSNSAALTKFRLVVPYTRPVSVADHDRLWRHFNHLFEGALDAATSDESRLFYFPSSCPDTGAPVARFELRDGAVFDPAPVLASLPPAPPEASSTAKSAEWRDEPVPQWSGPEDDNELIALAKRLRTIKARLGITASFSELWGADPEALQRAYPPENSGQAWSGNGADQALFNCLAYITGGDCERMLRLAMREDCMLRRDKWDRVGNYIVPTILEGCASAAKLGLYYNDGRKPPVTPDDSRPVIELRGGSFESNIAALLPVVSDAIYVQGGGLVRIGYAEQIARTQAGQDDTVEAAGIRRARKQAVCLSVSPDWLRLELMRRAQFWQHDERAGRFKQKDCPEEIAGTIVRQGSWPFRELNAISAVPVLRPDLSVWTTPGYDIDTGVLYQPTMGIPPIIDRPTVDDALAALARLREPFNQFPYSTPVSEAVFLSHIITAVIRASFDTSPLFFYTAPIAGTGKTLLAQMPQLIATGTVPANSPYSEREELRKVLFAALLAGDSCLILDNIPNGHKLRSPELCMFATAVSYADRMLGASKRREMPNRCTVVLTGNNITPVSDVARRAEVCLLDVNAESARDRDFRISDLKAYVRERRLQLIVDVFTIVRAYAFAGWPHVARPLESFEQWSRLARDPLVWLGLPDPVESQKTETEDEVGPLRGAFAAIGAATAPFGHRFTAGQLLNLALNPALTGGVQLREALDDAGCKELTERLHYWLRGKKNNVAAGWKLISEVDPATNLARYWLRRVA
jgi:hypothetical protein